MESCLNYVEQNGLYNLNPKLKNCSGEWVDARQMLKKQRIKDHPRIKALNGENGMYAVENIPSDTILYHYHGPELTSFEFDDQHDLDSNTLGQDRSLNWS